MTKNILALGVAALFTLSACSTTKAHFGYNEFKGDMPISSGNQSGEELGAVEGSKGGFVWTSCDEQARDAVRELIANTRYKGGNAVGNVKWRADGTSAPTCKKSWGFVLVWPFLFTPLFASSHVDGTAYKTSKSAAYKMGLMMLPENEREDEAFVDKVLTL